jgi:hypothetical protein
LGRSIRSSVNFYRTPRPVSNAVSNAVAATVAPDYTALSYAELAALAKKRGIAPTFPRANRARLIEALNG